MLVWELAWRPARAPWLAVLTVVLLEVTPRDVQPPELAGLVRLALTAAVVAAAALRPRRR